MNDEILIAEINENPEKGFRLLLQKFQESVYWHIRRLVFLHSDAEDASQETFLRVFRSIGSLRKHRSLTGWIYRIATNEALRILSQRKEGACALDSPDAGAVPADEYFDYSDLEAVRLQKAIRTLPPRQQLVFNLRYYDGLDYSQIGEITGSSSLNVKANYHIAKRKVVEYMKKHD